MVRLSNDSEFLCASKDPPTNHSTSTHPRSIVHVIIIARKIKLLNKLKIIDSSVILRLFLLITLRSGVGPVFVIRDAQVRIEAMQDQKWITVAISLNVFRMLSLRNFLQAPSSLPESLPKKIRIRYNFKAVVRALWGPLCLKYFRTFFTVTLVSTAAVIRAMRVCSIDFQSFLGYVHSIKSLKIFKKSTKITQFFRPSAEIN